MKTLNEWISEYGVSHQTPTNKRIHWVCVPAIVFSLIAMLHGLTPMFPLLALIGALFFYSRLSLRLTLWAALCFAVMWAVAAMLPKPFMTGLIIFVVAWIGQFYGHYVEGKKPSFFMDVQFLLIGPLWLLNQLDPQTHKTA